MATAQIRLNGVVGSNTNFAVDTVITYDNAFGGITTYLWELLYVPPGSAAAIAVPGAPSGTFTVDKEGSYLLKLTVDAATPGEDIDQVVAAVRFFRSADRPPAAGESIETDPSYGWAIDRNKSITDVNKMLTAGDIQVGFVPDSIPNIDGRPDIRRGDWFMCTGHIDINPSIVDEDIVPVWEPLDPTKMNSSSIVGVLHSDIQGNASGILPTVPNVPGLAGGIVVNIQTRGLIHGVAGTLDFLNLVKFPNIPAPGDKLFLTTEVGQCCNEPDEFGTQSKPGTGLASPRHQMLGYVIEAASPGAIMVWPQESKLSYNAPTKFDSAVVARSLRLGAAGPVGQLGDPPRTEPANIEIEFNISDPLSLYQIVNIEPNTGSAFGALFGDVADIVGGYYHGRLAMVNAIDALGSKVKAVTSGFIVGCSAAFPPGAVDGEVLYLSQTVGGTLVRYTSLIPTNPIVPLGRIVSTTLRGGIFAFDSSGSFLGLEVMIGGGGLGKNVLIVNAKGGAQYTSITDAITAINGGIYGPPASNNQMTVFVMGGQYNEAPAIPEYVNVVGLDGDNIVITGIVSMPSANVSLQNVSIIRPAGLRGIDVNAVAAGATTFNSLIKNVKVSIDNAGVLSSGILLECTDGSIDIVDCYVSLTNASDSARAISVNAVSGDPTFDLINSYVGISGDGNNLACIYINHTDDIPADFDIKDCSFGIGGAAGANPIVISITFPTHALRKKRAFITNTTVKWGHENDTTGGILYFNDITPSNGVCYWSSGAIFEVQIGVSGPSYHFNCPSGNLITGGVKGLDLTKCNVVGGLRAFTDGRHDRGSTLDRPTNLSSPGIEYFNTDENRPEWWDGTAWVNWDQSTLGARVLIVNENGEAAYTSISAAIVAASALSPGPGTDQVMIFLMNGEYNESFTLPEYVHLCGLNRDNVIITGEATIPLFNTSIRNVTFRRTLTLATEQAITVDTTPATKTFETVIENVTVNLSGGIGGVTNYSGIKIDTDALTPPLDRLILRNCEIEVDSDSDNCRSIEVRDDGTAIPGVVAHNSTFRCKGDGNAHYCFMSGMTVGTSVIFEFNDCHFEIEGSGGSVASAIRIATIGINVVALILKNSGILWNHSDAISGRGIYIDTTLGGIDWRSGYFKEQTSTYLYQIDATSLMSAYVGEIAGLRLSRCNILWGDSVGIQTLYDGKHDAGAEADRPVGLDSVEAKGFQYFNTDAGVPEWWDGTQWVSWEAAGILGNRVLVVNENGNTPYASITAAIAAASALAPAPGPGTDQVMIFVMNGQYNESFALPEYVHLCGLDRDNVIITGVITGSVKNQSIQNCFIDRIAAPGAACLGIWLVDPVSATTFNTKIRNVKVRINALAADTAPNGCLFFGSTGGIDKGLIVEDCLFEIFSTLGSHFGIWGQAQIDFTMTNSKVLVYGAGDNFFCLGFTGTAATGIRWVVKDSYFEVPSGDGSNYNIFRAIGGGFPTPRMELHDVDANISWNKGSGDGNVIYFGNSPSSEFFWYGGSLYCNPALVVNHIETDALSTNSNFTIGSVKGFDASKTVFNGSNSVVSTLRDGSHGRGAEADKPADLSIVADGAEGFEYFNTDIGIPEWWDGTQWINWVSYVLGARSLVVNSNGLAAFATIADAITAIGSIAPPPGPGTNQVVIFLAGGQFNESVTLPEYVHLVGIDRESIIINGTVLLPVGNCSVQNCTILRTPTVAAEIGILVGDVAAAISFNSRIKNVRVAIDAVGATVPPNYGILIQTTTLAAELTIEDSLIEIENGAIGDTGIVCGEAIFRLINSRVSVHSDTDSNNCIIFTGSQYYYLKDVALVTTGASSSLVAIRGQSVGGNPLPLLDMDNVDVYLLGTKVAGFSSVLFLLNNPSSNIRWSTGSVMVSAALTVWYLYTAAASTNCAFKIGAVKGLNFGISNSAVFSGVGSTIQTLMDGSHGVGPTGDEPPYLDATQAKGYEYFNTTKNLPEWWSGTSWIDWTTPLGARVLIVNEAGGTSYATIGAAVSAASGMSPTVQNPVVIFVMPGYYNAEGPGITVPENVHIIGKGKNDVIVKDTWFNIRTANTSIKHLTMYYFGDNSGQIRIDQTPVSAEIWPAVIEDVFCYLDVSPMPFPSSPRNIYIHPTGDRINESILIKDCEFQIHAARLYPININIAHSGVGGNPSILIEGCKLLIDDTTTDAANLLYGCTAAQPNPPQGVVCKSCSFEINNSTMVGGYGTNVAVIGDSAEVLTMISCDLIMDAANSGGATLSFFWFWGATVIKTIWWMSGSAVEKQTVNYHIRPDVGGPAHISYLGTISGLELGKCLGGNGIFKPFPSSNFGYGTTAQRPTNLAAGSAHMRWNTDLDLPEWRDAAQSKWVGAAQGTWHLYVNQKGGGQFTSIADAVTYATGLARDQYNQVVIDLADGWYDLGGAIITLPQFVSVIGKGRDFTIITNGGFSVFVSDCLLKDLTISNSATTTTIRNVTITGLGPAWANHPTRLENVRLYISSYNASTAIYNICLHITGVNDIRSYQPQIFGCQIEVYAGVDNDACIWIDNPTPCGLWVENSSIRQTYLGQGVGSANDTYQCVIRFQNVTNSPWINLEFHDCVIASWGVQPGAGYRPAFGIGWLGTTAGIAVSFYNCHLYGGVSFPDGGSNASLVAMGGNNGNVLEWNGGTIYEWAGQYQISIDGGATNSYVRLKGVAGILEYECSGPAGSFVMYPTDNMGLGTTAQRPTYLNSGSVYQRWNTDLDCEEWYDGPQSKWVGPAEGRSVLYVNPNGGGQFTTLDAAITYATALPRDTNNFVTIRMAPGRYWYDPAANPIKNFSLPEYVILEGAPGNGTILDNAKVTIFDNNNVIRNIQFTGAPTNVAYSQVDIQYASAAWGINTRIEDCWFNNYQTGAFNYTRNILIAPPGDRSWSSIYINNCWFWTQNGRDYAVNICHARNNPLYIDNCTFVIWGGTGNYKSNISFQNNTNAAGVIGHIIRNCYFQTVGGDGGSTYCIRFEGTCVNTHIQLQSCVLSPGAVAPTSSYGIALIGSSGANNRVYWLGGTLFNLNDNSIYQIYISSWNASDNQYVYLWHVDGLRFEKFKFDTLIVNSIVTVSGWDAGRRVIYVSNDGNGQFSTLQAAFDYAQYTMGVGWMAPVIIYVSPGLYNGGKTSITVPEGVQIIGQQGCGEGYSGQVYLYDYYFQVPSQNVIFKNINLGLDNTSSSKSTVTINRIATGGGMFYTEFVDCSISINDTNASGGNNWAIDINPGDNSGHRICFYNCYVENYATKGNGGTVRVANNIEVRGKNTIFTLTYSAAGYLGNSVTIRLDSATANTSLLLERCTVGTGGDCQGLGIAACIYYNTTSVNTYSYFDDVIISAEAYNAAGQAYGIRIRGATNVLRFFTGQLKTLWGGTNYQIYSDATASLSTVLGTIQGLLWSMCTPLSGNGSINSIHSNSIECRSLYYGPDTKVAFTLGNIGVSDRIRWVSKTSGTQYTTIQAAINSCSGPSNVNQYTIYVMPGDYSESISIPSGVNVIGVGTGHYVARLSSDNVPVVQMGAFASSLVNFQVFTSHAGGAAGVYIYAENQGGINHWDEPSEIRDCFIYQNSTGAGVAGIRCFLDGAGETIELKVVNTVIYCYTGSVVATSYGIRVSYTADAWMSLKVDNCDIRADSAGAANGYGISLDLPLTMVSWYRYFEVKDTLLWGKRTAFYYTGYCFEVRCDNVQFGTQDNTIQYGMECGVGGSGISYGWKLTACRFVGGFSVFQIAWGVAKGSGSLYVDAGTSFKVDQCSFTGGPPPDVFFGTSQILVKQYNGTLVGITHHNSVPTATSLDNAFGSDAPIGFIGLYNDPDEIDVAWICFRASDGAWYSAEANRL